MTFHLRLSYAHHIRTQGFRYRVLRLRQDQKQTTIDGQFIVPYGTAVKVSDVSADDTLHCANSKETHFTFCVVNSIQAVASTTVHLSK